MKQQAEWTESGAIRPSPSLRAGAETDTPSSGQCGRQRPGGRSRARQTFSVQLVIIAFHQVAFPLPLPPPTHPETKSLNPGEDCGRCVGGRFWGGCREGGLEPQLIAGKFNGILNAGATPSNYLGTKGWGPQVWKSGLGGLGRRCVGEGSSYNPSDFSRNLRHSLEL